jgi:hypothetical protein
MLEIITIILSILVVILGYTTFNLLRKNEKYEDSIENYISFFNNISNQIHQSEKRLKEIDEKGIFAGDDEIGWFFNEVKKIQNNLSKFKINP